MQKKIFFRIGFGGEVKETAGLGVTQWWHILGSRRTFI
jgi:hypothetical protein